MISWKDKQETLFPRLVRNFFPYDVLYSPSGWEIHALPEGTDIRYTVYYRNHKKISYKKKNTLLDYMIENSLPLDFVYCPNQLQPIHDKAVDTLGFLPKVDYYPSENLEYPIDYYLEKFDLFNLAMKFIHKISFLIQAGQTFWFQVQGK